MVIYIIVEVIILKLTDIGRRFTDASQIQITGKEAVLIDGCKKIIEYNDIVVRVKVREMTVCVWGSGLYASSFGTDCVYIYGKISSVELE